MKKFFYTILVVGLVGALAFGAYWYFEKQQSGSAGGGSLSVGDLFPFGNGGGAGGNTTPPPAPVVATSTPNIPAPVARLWKISTDPQSGAGVFLRDGDTFVRFVDTATGNVFENKLGTAGLTRVTNTTIPKIREALWTQKGESAVLRYATDNDSIQTLFAQIPAPKATASTTGETTDIRELQTNFLASNVVNLAVFGPKDKIFYVTKNSAGNASGFVANTDGTKSARLFDSPITEWAAAWPKEDMAVITTKPSALALGFSYFVSTKTGALQKLIGNVPGLSVLSASDATHTIYSMSTGDRASLHSYNVKTGVDGTLANTFAEKCVWSKDNLNVFCAVPRAFPSGTYPDDWYKGKVSFADTFTEFNTETNRGMSLLDPKTITDQNIDAANLFLDPSERFLLFTNKKDNSLWAYRVVNQ